jgi:rubredoxin
MRRLLFAISVFFVLLHVDSHASPVPLTLGSPDVTVVYEKELARVAGDVIKAYPHVRDDLIHTLGQEVDFRPEVVLLRDRDKFREISGSDMTIAFALPSRNLIVIDTSRVYARPFTLETTMKHELCHLILHRRIANQSIPRWFDEGVCQWSSGGFAELMADGGDRVLSKAVVSETLIGLDRLDSFPDDGQNLVLAYEESKSVIDFIVSEYGKDAVLRILDQMKKGDSMNESISKSLSISPEDLEKNWRTRLKRKHTLLLYLSNNIYVILFALAALMTFYGFIRIMKRKRSYAEEEEEELEMPKYKCTSVCGYTYDPYRGDVRRGVDGGTPFEELPDDWTCPVCGAGKNVFKREA